MSKLEPSIYIIGSKKHQQIRLHSLKKGLIALGILLFSMAGIIVAQYFWRTHSVEQAQMQLQQEQLKSKKLYSLLQSSDQSESNASATFSSTSSTQEIPTASPEKTPQILLWEQQQQKLEELQAQLKNKETPYQKRNQKLRTQNKTLKAENQKLKQQERDFVKTVFSLKSQKKGLLKQITSLRAKSPQNSQGKKAQTRSSETPNLSSVSPIIITDFTSIAKGTKQKIQFNIQNTTDLQQKGKVGMFLLNPKTANPDPQKKHSGIKAFSIKYFKNIKWSYRVPKSSQKKELRILIWNAEDQLIYKDTFDIPSSVLPL